MTDAPQPWLIVMDVDSTVIRDEVIELIAGHAGVRDEVAAVTEAAMRGELDFAQSLRARVALLEGLPESVLEEVWGEVRFTPGAHELCAGLRERGHIIALVSGGFTHVVEHIGAALGVQHLRANVLELVDGRLTGRVIGAIVDRAGKAAALRHYAELHDIPLERTVAIGDGANDLDMMEVAAIGIAFNAKPVVQAAADHAINGPRLDAALQLIP